MGLATVLADTWEIATGRREHRRGHYSGNSRILSLDSASADTFWLGAVADHHLDVDAADRMVLNGDLGRQVRDGTPARKVDGQ